jgi:inorganic pyrophosphatase
MAVLYNDALYSQFKKIQDVPETIIRRLEHYFLTYKDMPGEHRDCEITHTYGVEEAHDLIGRSMEDYKEFVENLLFEDKTK